MKSPAALALVLLACCLPAFAQDQGPWLAGSPEAKKVTGDISVEG